MAEAPDLGFGLGDSSYVFTDKELSDLLGVIESKAAGVEPVGELEVLDFFRADASQPLALQFQPRSHKDSALEPCGPIKQEQEPLGHSALSSALASPVDTPALQQAAAPDQPFMANSAAEISILPMPHPALNAAFALPSVVAAPVASPFGVAGLVAPQPQMAHSTPSVPALPIAQMSLNLPRYQSVPAAGKGQHSPLPRAPPPLPPPPEPKGQISHSTVEKQRRDRINSLIDELRELVPPQQRSNNGAAAAEGMEARRPKHVVLADTITLLKHMQQKLSISAMDPAANGHLFFQLPGLLRQDDDTANSEGKSKSSSHEDVEMAGAPQMPHIPCQVTQNAGVTVERGPDCYYVQVKCRDRKGLLSDIINALRQLPLEIRTAAVTTTNGTVRDVFEVKLDEPSLSPEDVQNLVHDALFQQHIVPLEPFAGKRPRA